MIEETGIVISIEGATAKVVVDKKGSCEGCCAQEACRPSSGGMEIEALNYVDAREGQTVRVAMGNAAGPKSSLIIYLLPLILFIAGAIAGKGIARKYLQALNSDLISAVAAFAALALSFLIIKLWNKKAEAKTGYKPYIEEIISS